VADRVDASILRYRMPGFMLEDIHNQLGAHDNMDRLSEVLEEANRVRQDLGYPPLVAPIRQMIATQAVNNVIGGERYATVTQELKDYLQGLYGRPPVPADHELRRLVLGREEPITIRPADLLEPQAEGARQQVKKLGFDPSEDTVLAPMQGLIVKVPVKPGDMVKLGDVVAVLEAMKMQNDIVTTVAGKVAAVYVKEGEVVSPNQPLLAIG